MERRGGGERREIERRGGGEGRETETLERVFSVEELYRFFKGPEFDSYHL